MKARWKSTRRTGAPQAPLAGKIYGFSKGLAVLLDGSGVIVTNEQGSTVTRLSTVDGTIAWETPLVGAGPAGSANPGAVVMRPVGQPAYVTA